MAERWDAIVIGGGFFGCNLALTLASTLPRVLLVESESALCTRASYRNQARVHNGYHYPRSVLTAARSRANFPLFLRDFGDCIEDKFTQLYAVARLHSKVSASQFRSFFERIGAPIKAAPVKLKKLFDPHLIEEVYVTEEVAFDAARISRVLAERLADSGIEVRLSSPVSRIDRQDGMFSVEMGPGRSELADRVFNCTYSGINRVLKSAGRGEIPLKHELAELALVEVPPELKDVGVTVMCGPFFSIMPFPSEGLHSLSHVRYTPHRAWVEPRAVSASSDFETPPSNFVYMRQDALRYVPTAASIRHVRSLWETKTILPQAEYDDARPILFQRDPEWDGFYSVMGGKIDNIYDLPRELESILKRGNP